MYLVSGAKQNERRQFIQTHYHSSSKLARAAAAFNKEIEGFMYVSELNSCAAIFMISFIFLTIGS